MSKYLVARGPSTQEDEGRSFLLAGCHTKKEAKELKKKNDGYYIWNIYKRVD